MTAREPRYSKEDHARRGTEIYNRQVRAQVELGNNGRIVAIDVDSGDYEVSDDGLEAAGQLLARRPAAQIWCVRIGYPAVHRFGPRTVVVQATQNYSGSGKTPVSTATRTSSGVASQVAWYVDSNGTGTYKSLVRNNGMSHSTSPTATHSAYATRSSPVR